MQQRLGGHAPQSNKGHWLTFHDVYLAHEPTIFFDKGYEAEAIKKGEDLNGYYQQRQLLSLLPKTLSPCESCWVQLLRRFEHRQRYLAFRFAAFAGRYCA